MNLNSFESLNETDRANLCDIAWFIKGLNSSGSSPFVKDHEDTLGKVIGSLSNQIQDKKIVFPEKSTNRPG